MSCRILRSPQKLRQYLMQARTNGPRAIMLLFQQTRRDNHVGIDRPEWNSEIAAHAASPAFCLPQWVLVPDHHARVRLRAELQQDVLWIGPKYKPDSALCQSFRDVGDTVSQEAEVAVVSVGV